MLNENLRHHYLEHMGIDIWTLKQTSLNILSITSKNLNVLLMATISGDAAVEQQQLWEKITAALARYPLQINALDETQYRAGNFQAYKTCWLGEAFDEASPASIKTHSLRDIIQDTSLKAAVWKTLRVLLSI